MTPTIDQTYICTKKCLLNMSQFFFMIDIPFETKLLQRWHKTALKVFFLSLKNTPTKKKNPQKQKPHLKSGKYLMLMRLLSLSSSYCTSHSLISFAILSEIYFEPGGSKRSKKKMKHNTQNYLFLNS